MDNDMNLEGFFYKNLVEYSDKMNEINNNPSLDIPTKKRMENEAMEKINKILNKEIEKVKTEEDKEKVITALQKAKNTRFGAFKVKNEKCVKHGFTSRTKEELEKDGLFEYPDFATDFIAICNAIDVILYERNNGDILPYDVVTETVSQLSEIDQITIINFIKNISEKLNQLRPPEMEV